MPPEKARHVRRALLRPEHAVCHGGPCRVGRFYDEPLIRWSLTTRLKEEGYRLLEAETAAETLERSREGADLLLLEPFNVDEIALLVAKALETTQLRREVGALRATRPGPTAWIASSASARPSRPCGR